MKTKKAKLTIFDVLPLKVVDMETMEKKSVADWILEVKKLRGQLRELKAVAKQTLLTPSNLSAREMLADCLK